MSNRMFSWQHAIRSDSSLEPLTKFVLYNLSTHMAPDGSGCFPSLKTQAKETGLGLSTVKKHLSIAADRGWVLRECRQSGEGDQTSTLYSPTWPEGVGHHVARVGHDMAEGRPPRGRGVGHHVAPNKPIDQTNEQTNKNRVVLTPLGELSAVVDDERAQGIVDHRKALKAPLTAFGARKLAKELAKSDDPNAAADEMVARGWRGFKVAWMKERGNGQERPSRTKQVVLNMLEEIRNDNGTRKSIIE